MSKLQTFELLLMLAALAGQGYYFFVLLRRLRQYQRIFPAVEHFHIRKINLPPQAFRAPDTREVLRKYLEEEGKHTAIGGTELSFIDTNVPKNATLDQILLSVNAYLLKSRGAAIDFTIIRHMVMRRCTVMRQGIVRQSLFPLFIGLMALLLGVGLGLFFLPNLSQELMDSALSRSRAALFFSAARLAAVPVLTGFLFTSLLLVFLYPAARSHLAQRRDEFYNFVQTELLPVLFQDTTHSLNQLQVSLNTFQRNFMESVASLGELMHKNYESLMAQEKTIAAIKEIDVMRLAEANLEMFRELGKSADELQKFTQYLTSMDSFIANTASLNEKINEWLGRTQDLQNIARNVEQTMQKNERLQAFIQSHFSELERRGQLINNTVIKVDDVLDKSLNELMEHTRTKIRAIRELAVREEDQLLKAFDDNKHIFGKLAKIDDLYQHFAAYSTQDAARQQQILAELQRLNEYLLHRKSNASDNFLKKLLGK